MSASVPPPVVGESLDEPPLAGLVVLDLTRFVSGPYCTMLMADAGATVIKVEPPGGEDTRLSRPRFPSESCEAGLGATYIRMNRGKKSVVMDLKSPRGKDALTRLIQGSDVLVENFRAGVLDRLGFDEETIANLNPALIYCSISGFGHTATPWRDRPAFNLIAEYEAGLYFQAHADDAPRPLGPYVGDMFPGLHALSGLLMALYRRGRTGRGGRVDIAMFDSMLSLNELACSNEAWLGDEWSPFNMPNFCPSGVFKSRDGYVCIDVVTDKQWMAFCRAIGHNELFADPRLASGPARSAEFQAVLEAPLLAWLNERPSEASMQILTEFGVPAAVVRRPGEALQSPQATARGMRLEVDAGFASSLRVAGSPIRISGTMQPAAPVVASAGEHTVEVLVEIAGMSIDDAKGIVAT